MDHHHDLLKRPAHRGGFTLIEMALVLALSATLLTVFYSFLASQMMDAADESSEIRVQAGIRTPMSELVEELQDAHLYALDSYGNWMCYQVPQVGTSGSIILGVDANNNPVVNYGAYAFSDGSWLQGGYYQIMFNNHTGPSDILIENAITTTNSPSGQNLSGTYATGSTTFTVGYDKGYQVGHFEIECHAAPANPISSVNPCPQTAYGFSGISPTPSPYPGPGGALYPVNGSNTRVIAGTALRQIDPTDAATPKRTSPWGGGFFFMRNASNTNFTYNASGGTSGSLVWSAQSPDTFTTGSSSNDTNGNGVWDLGETYTDTNKNNSYDGPDCDAFIDSNNDNIFDGNEAPTSVGVSKLQWNGSLRIQMCAFDVKKLITTNAERYTSQAAVRTISTKVKIRNK